MKVIKSAAITAFLEQCAVKHNLLYEQLRHAEKSGDTVEWQRILSFMNEMDEVLDSMTALEENGTGAEFKHELVSVFVDSGLALATEAIEKGCDVIVAKLDEDDIDEVAYYFIGHEDEILVNLKDKFAKFLQ